MSTFGQFLACFGTFFIYSQVVTPFIKVLVVLLLSFLAVIFFTESFNSCYLFMSDMAFVNVIGSLNVYFRFNSCLI